MKIAVSNIAWDLSEQDAVKQLMLDRGVKGVEIAPTKVWSDPKATTAADWREYRKYWNQSGIEIVAMQALLFGHPELTIFEDKDTRAKTLAYLCFFMDMAQELGAKALVFGSPGNRSAGWDESSEKQKIAVEFFAALGDYATSRETFFCVEPNPGAYDNKFVRDTQEAVKFVKAVNNQGFRLHLDSGVMTVNKENIEKSIESAVNLMCHFHISHPGLKPVEPGEVDHQAVLDALKKVHWNKWISVEIKNGWTTPNTDCVRKSLDFVVKTYAG